MEEQSTLLNHRPTNYLRNYLSSTFSHFLPLNHPCINGGYSELRIDDDSDDGSSPDHAYCKPFVVLDVIWNLGFVFVSAFVLLCTIREKPSCPLRVWIVGYALQCLLHVGFVYYEFRRRNHGSLGGVSSPEGHSQSHNSIMKRLESVNTVASSFWWVFGFYWIVSGGQTLLQDSPRLYWLSVVFLALDVFFMIFCVGMACIICMALFCCIPIVAIAYAMTIREGASEDEIKQLPKYRFHESYASGLSASLELVNMNVADKLALQLEDSECCICLSRYVEGVELCTLPCNHNFHHGCISRWLRINATCPLCKFNIKAKGDDALV
ncbi:hypothetical protein SOVF_000540 [Spinacia oleracea]|uniref:RING-type E3 ubiquitin transferase n=1 Tax=Spinacia oleracea TaxID=3562 RepID=A0A9R0HYR9_SPIOL|nr:E3 ubiquitin-protein ligase At4g11680-like [Spinacia oleracea]KNA26007.1 hypothetical protein SOVF_000540 [Spinacia oleracea]